MNARSLNPSAGNDSATMRPLEDAIPPRQAPAGPTDRACCCLATAMVKVIMPPTPARPHRTDLLLCGHHYRVSRQALTAAGATVHELPWISDSTAAWLHLECHEYPAQTS
jgi:hypothetical protein